jgi:hypothetical protein
MLTYTYFITHNIKRVTCIDEDTLYARRILHGSTFSELKCQDALPV